MFLKKCLIVSQETFKTGEVINKKRLENNLAALTIHVVELIKEADLVDKGDEDKVSSSNERRHILGTLIKPPYVI